MTYRHDFWLSSLVTKRLMTNKIKILSSIFFAYYKYLFISINSERFHYLDRSGAYKWYEGKLEKRFYFCHNLEGRKKKPKTLMFRPYNRVPINIKCIQSRTLNSQFTLTFKKITFKLYRFYVIQTYDDVCKLSPTVGVDRSGAVSRVKLRPWRPIVFKKRNLNIFRIDAS